MNTVAFYLPQYHQVPENDLWWGEGYTEWSSLKKGQQRFDGQYQPRIPLNNNYYDLKDIDVIRWQANLAKKHGVNSFCVYHYWFDGKLLLEKPMENFLHSEIEFPFFFCWANETWTTVWNDRPNERKILASNDYSNSENWDKHFYYCLDFFKDKRYIKKDNKPLFVIYNPIVINYLNLKNLLNRWNELAIKNGFAGMTYLYQTGNSLCFMDNGRKKLFDYALEYYPGLTDWRSKNIFSYYFDIFKRRIVTSHDDAATLLQDYDNIWKKIMNYIPPKESNIIPGAFTDWDNSPRRKFGAKIILNSSPEKFKYYFKEQLLRAKELYKKNMVVIFAWNEWSEGGYLEPDERYKYGYLEAIKQALIETNEFQDEFDNDFVI